MTRHTFEVPVGIVGDQLADEMRAAGVEASVYIESDMLAVYADADEATVRALVEAHSPPPSPTPEWENERTLAARADSALTANAAFLALASPTQAQTLAQVKTLTKECTALIRLLLRKFDSADGT